MFVIMVIKILMHLSTIFDQAKQGGAVHIFRDFYTACFEKSRGLIDILDQLLPAGSRHNLAIEEMIMPFRRHPWAVRGFEMAAGEERLL